MARAIKQLRREGQLAAVVDLAQIGARAENVDAGRWYYSIAYRILRELRLKVDLQTWWQEKSALMSEQRLAEFFSEIVLTNTTVAVTIFFDEIERSLALPFSQELFSSIHACYSRRVTEPEYARLNFVVLGVASAARLCPDTSVSPFVDGRAVDLEDFTVEQSYRLAPGFGGEPSEARPIIQRIHSWTGGQPYFTQKVARGVARRNGRLEDVDKIVREQFLVPGVAQEEPLLNHMRGLLTERLPNTRQTLSLLSKVAKGDEVYADPSSAAVEALRLAGVASIDRQQRLRYRNKICANVFGTRWANAALPFDWRTASAAAAAVAAVILLPFWYTQYLPRPYIRTLSVVAQDFAVAEQAYEKLHRLPGFARTADRLMAEAMARRSAAADSFAELVAADAVLRELPEQSALADQLMGEYWLRRSMQARHAERRDEALFYSMQALAGKPEEVHYAAAELIGDDYKSLQRTFRLPATPARWEADWQRRSVTVIDPAHRARLLRLDPAGQSRDAALPDRLTALQHVPVRRELSVDETGSAGAFELLLSVRHPRANELSVTLAAPNGAQASVSLPERVDEGTFIVTARAGAPLATLSDEERQGVWRLTVVDRVTGGLGTLSGWGLRFGASAEPRRDDLEQGIEIPDPVRTEQVTVEVSADGRLAIARPSRPGAVGSIALWDLNAGRLRSDLQIPTMPEHVALNSSGTRLLVLADSVLTLWDVAAGVSVATVATQTEFVLPPAIDPDGDYVAIAERVDAQPPLFSLLRAEDGELVASVEGVANATAWVLGPQARYLALLGTSRVVQILDPRRGERLLELRHDKEVRRLIPLPADDLLVTVDAAGDLRAWPIAIGTTERIEPRRLGTTVDAASVSVAAGAATIAYESAHGHVIVRDVEADRELYDVRVERSGLRIATKLSPDGDTLLTANGRVLRLWALDGTASGVAADPDLSALAIDANARIAALGFRGGNVQVRSSSDLDLDRGDARAKSVDYIGHRGPVTSLALDASSDLIASGGADGVVRLWDLASVAPTEHFMRHPAGPVHAVALSHDGAWIASAAEYTARIWHADDGRLSGEIPVNGTALTVGFSPDDALLAVGDSAGNLFFGEPAGSKPVRSSRAQGAVRHVAFAPDGRYVVTGDEAGNVQLWDPPTADAVGEAYVFPSPVHWVGFGADEAVVLARTDHWVHSLELGERGLQVVNSRLLPAGLEAGAALAALDGKRLRLVGGRGLGRPVFVELEVGAAPAEPLPENSPLLMRDWSPILGMRLNDNGVVVPFAP